MLGVVEDVVEVTLLDHPPGVHNQDPVGDLGDDAEVVGYQQRRQVSFAVEPFQEVEDLGLDRDVERGRRLVGDQHLGFERQRHRDHRPLTLPAREFVRVEPDPPLGLRIPTASSISIARSRASRSPIERWARTASTIWSPTL